MRLYSCFLFLLFLTLVPFSVSKSIESETTTVKILVPVPSPSFDEDDEAVIIDADPSSGPIDTTPDSFNVSDCFMKPVKGPCRAIIESWYYDSKSGTGGCKTFNYSGCGGNNNRFSEKEFCDNHCTTKVNNNKEKKQCPDPGCGPLKCGTFLDLETGCEKCDCELGSVSGNPDDANQQSHVKHKNSTTTALVTGSDKPEDICHLPETRGNCRAMVTRWRYNPTLKDCIPFHYGGCDGNPNNFVSQDKCKQFCKGQ